MCMMGRLFLCMWRSKAGFGRFGVDCGGSFSNSIDLFLTLGIYFQKHTFYFLNLLQRLVPGNYCKFITQLQIFVIDFKGFIIELGPYIIDF
jgi:hypothetical protein